MVEPIGVVVRLQVQRASLKAGQAPRRRYDPAPLQPVPALLVTEAGVTGRDERGETVADVHHRDHPASKNRAGGNGVSVCFTSHYDAMRARFGPHLADGLAGENILVAADRRYDAAELAPGLVIETSSGERVRLEQVNVAAPCVEFARFALRFPDDLRPDRRVTEALAFLDGGTRGYYAVGPAGGVPIAVGDQVFVAR